MWLLWQEYDSPQNDPHWGQFQKLIMVKSEGKPLCIREHSSCGHLLFPYEELEGSKALGRALRKMEVRGKNLLQALSESPLKTIR